jgi:hypothetical protein
MRYYTIQGPDRVYRLPSVTTILEATMPQQRRAVMSLAQARDPMKYHKATDGGRSRGTNIDAYAKAKFLGKAPHRHADYHAYYRHFDRWFDASFDGGLCWTDEIVYDPGAGYAGTLDVLVPLRTGMTLLDIKTCAHKVWDGAVESAMLQTAAYASAWAMNHVALRAEAIAALFISPYGTVFHSASGDEMNNLIAAFHQRCKQFPAALSAASE